MNIKKDFYQFIAKFLVYVMVMQGMPLWQISQAYEWDQTRLLKLLDAATSILAPAEAHAATCKGDLFNDGDVDGPDLAVFAADFGRTDCATGDPCEGDFGGDNDVDDSDLAVFATDFGRTDCDRPPEIDQVYSSIYLGRDNDNEYPTGSVVRIDVAESSGESDIVSGTIRITSASQGYDSGVQPMLFGTPYFLLDTKGLSPAVDYIATITLTDAAGQTATDDSLAIELKPNPPAINKLVRELDISVPGVGLSTNIVRTYLLNSEFEGPLGYGWTHTYLIYVVENEIIVPGSHGGLVQVFNADGTGSFFTSNGNGTYESPKGDFRTLTKATDGTFMLREKFGTLYHFDTKGELKQIEDRNGNTLTFGYANNLLTTITDTSGQTTLFSYNTDKRIETITDPAGRSASYGYDSAGNLTSVTNIGGFVTVYDYNADHNLTTITDPGGKRTFFSADTEDRLVSVSGEGGANSLTYEYEKPNSDQMTITDADGNQTVLTYDLYSMIIGILDPEGNYTSMTYDDDLNLITITDGNVNQRSMVYDGRGNMLTLKDAEDYSVASSYDPVFNRITSLTDARNNNTVFYYDANGNLEKIIYPEETGVRAEESFSYNSFGNLTSKIDRMGQTTTYSYDPINGKITQKLFPDGTSDTFSYDAYGNVKTATDENGTITFDYDNLNRLEQVTYPGGEVVSYDYDDASNHKQLIYPDGTVLDYIYDDFNRLEEISISGQVIASYTYDSMSRVERRDLQNGIYSTYNYNDSGWLEDLINRKSTSDIISSFTYTHDNVGNRLTMTTLDGTTQYIYDKIYRLTDVILPDSSTTTYNLDPAGNRDTVTNSSGTTDYSVNDLNQYTDVGGDAYTYDANGNLESKTTVSGVTTYTYDFENQLIQVDTPVETINYTYDPFGRRISNTTSAGTTNYIYL